MALCAFLWLRPACTCHGLAQPGDQQCACGARRNLGAGISSLLTDRERLGVAVAGLSVAALGIYSAREGTRVAGRAFDR